MLSPVALVSKSRQLSRPLPHSQFPYLGKVFCQHLVPGTPKDVEVVENLEQLESLLAMLSYSVHVDVHQGRACYKLPQFSFNPGWILWSFQLTLAETSPLSVPGV